MVASPAHAQFAPAMLEDVPRLATFMPDLYAYEGAPPDVAAWSAALAELVQTPSLGQVWVIQLDGQPIGYVALTFGYSLEFGGRDAFIDELYIDEPHRGQGIGGQAIEFIETYARSSGLRSLHLEVDDYNVNGQRFYETRGFHFRRHMHLMSKRLA